MGTQKVEGVIHFFLSYLVHVNVTIIQNSNLSSALAPLGCHDDIHSVVATPFPAFVTTKNDVTDATTIANNNNNNNNDNNSNTIALDKRNYHKIPASQTNNATNTFICSLGSNYLCHKKFPKHAITVFCFNINNLVLFNCNEANAVVPVLSFFFCFKFVFMKTHDSFKFFCFPRFLKIYLKLTTLLFLFYFTFFPLFLLKVVSEKMHSKEFNNKKKDLQHVMNPHLCPKKKPRLCPNKEETLYVHRGTSINLAGSNPNKIDGGKVSMCSSTLGVLTLPTLLPTMPSKDNLEKVQSQARGTLLNVPVLSELLPPWPRHDILSHLPTLSNDLMDPPMP
ncbi:hypothetical protein RFI_09231, partial [Reticulomyxa filosa]